MPDWYKNREQKDSNFIYGYGVAKNKAHAKSLALTEISGVIESKVKSEINCSATKIDDSTEESCLAEYAVTTNRLLSGAIVDKEDIFKDQYFIRVAYDFSAPETKLVREIKKLDIDCKDKRQTLSNPFLRSSPFIQQVAKQVSCLPELSLFRRDAL
jgi:hypothetical protein